MTAKLCARRIQKTPDRNCRFHGVGCTRSAPRIGYRIGYRNGDPRGRMLVRIALRVAHAAPEQCAAGTCRMEDNARAQIA
jgi:hypothetical protein